MQQLVADMVARLAPRYDRQRHPDVEHGGQPDLAPHVAAKAGLAGLILQRVATRTVDRIQDDVRRDRRTETEGEDAASARRTAPSTSVQQEVVVAAMGKLGQVDEIVDFVAFLPSAAAPR